MVTFPVAACANWIEIPQDNIMEGRGYLSLAFNHVGKYVTFTRLFFSVMQISAEQFLDCYNVHVYSQFFY